MNPRLLYRSLLFFSCLAHAQSNPNAPTEPSVLRDAVSLPAPDIVWKAQAYGRDGVRLTTRKGDLITLYVQGNALRPMRLDRLRGRVYPDVEVHAWAMTRVASPADTTRPATEAP